MVRKKVISGITFHCRNLPRKLVMVTTIVAERTLSTGDSLIPIFYQSTLTKEKTKLDDVTAVV
jgi:hypothetical protein